MGGEKVVIGEGAAAVVLKRYADAVRDGDRVYAVIESVEGKGDLGSVGAALREAVEEAYGDEVEGSVQREIGHAGAASGIAAVIRAAVCLSEERVPTEGEVRYWVRDRVEGARRVRVSARGVDGNCVQVEMREKSGIGSEKSEVRSRSSELMEGIFRVEAETPGELVTRLEELERMVRAARSVGEAARRWHGVHGGAKFSVVAAIVGKGKREVVKGIGRLKKAIGAGAAIDEGGAFYSLMPLARMGSVAFVFPGAGNEFAGMGRELAAQFPTILRRQDLENERLGSQVAAGVFWTEGAAQNISHRDAIFGQVALGTVVYDLMALFGVVPAAAIGYSLGETTA